MLSAVLRRLLLQFRYNLTDEALIARCIRDLGFRYALDCLEETSSGVSSFDGSARGSASPRVPVVVQALSTLPKDAGLIDDAELQVADSTNTDCRGAICDTYNLIARGIGGVVREVARCKGQKAETLAKTWGLTQYLGRSIKSAVTIDWSDVAERNALLTGGARRRSPAAARSPHQAGRGSRGARILGEGGPSRRGAAS
ncbi:MAG: transposase [Myxococcota bacterium]